MKTINIFVRNYSFNYFSFVNGEGEARWWWKSARTIRAFVLIVASDSDLAVNCVRLSSSRNDYFIQLFIKEIMVDETFDLVYIDDFKGFSAKSGFLSFPIDILGLIPAWSNLNLFSLSACHKRLRTSKEPLTPITAIRAGTSKVWI